MFYRDITARFLGTCLTAHLHINLMLIRHINASYMLPLLNPAFAGESRHPRLAGEGR